MAKFIEEKPVMVFAREYEGNRFYSIGISKKDIDGEWENAYMNCRFKKDIKLHNKTKILIKDAWLSFYKTEDNKTNWYIFINEFDIVDENLDSEDTVDEVDLSDILGDSEIEVSDSDLPFD